MSELNAEALYQFVKAAQPPEVQATMPPTLPAEASVEVNGEEVPK